MSNENASNIVDFSVSYNTNTMRQYSARLLQLFKQREKIDQKIISVHSEMVKRSFSISRKQSSSNQQQMQKLDSNILKDKKMKVCNLCKIEVHRSKLTCHVKMVHLKTPLYFCALCNKTSNYSSNNIKMHMRRKHGIHNGEPINITNSHATEVQRLMKQCFPDVKSRTNITTTPLDESNDSD
ncbi:Formin-homology and zinc finger domains protein [Dirofilaria immitis]|nr:hypothetical protein [Dirofilaria immitis]